jgi:alkylation response protein AidB-like acyl-CoA dehydrogenase
LPAADVDIEPLESSDATRPLGRLTVRDVPLADGLLLHGDARPGLLLAFAALAAELVGVADELVGRSVAYARERRQFGTPIGAFQAVKHRLVDAHLAVERARALAYGAAVALARGAPDEQPEVAVHLAKAAASEAAVTAARTAVQVHGGIGITWESDVSFLYARARQAAGLLGGARRHYLAADALHRSAEGGRAVSASPSLSN